MLPETARLLDSFPCDDIGYTSRKIVRTQTGSRHNASEFDADCSGHIRVVTMLTMVQADNIGEESYANDINGAAR